jgi:hypothetical protein
VKLPDSIHPATRWRATELVCKAVNLIQQVLIGEPEFPVRSEASLTKRLVPTPEFILTNAMGILPIFQHFSGCRGFLQFIFDPPNTVENHLGIRYELVAPMDGRYVPAQFV